METIRVLESGPLATIQDRGRLGYQDRGVPVSGAMDRLALRVANLLVGNAEGEACIEITLGGFRAEFLRRTQFSLTGADQTPLLNGQPIANWACHQAEAGDMLALDWARLGCRSYLAVGGGMDVPIVLGSRSTYVRGGFGGFDGRALRKGDILHSGKWVGGALHAFPEELLPRYSREPLLRVVLGPQDDCITPEGIVAFLSQRFETTERMDRMGCSLRGPAIPHTRGPDIVSDGIVCGAVQIPGSRHPILLMADAPTIGGYVKLATVASFDLPLVAQLQPGCHVRFQALSLLEAREIYLKQEYMLRNLPLALRGQSAIGHGM
jgi:biotin-dependent carboxylase-like uncharacterized protein